jgi:hypothetical protein
VCEKCAALDEKIARCERLRTLVTDRLTIDGIEALVRRYLAEKLSLHPELQGDDLKQHQ